MEDKTSICDKGEEVHCFITDNDGTTLYLYFYILSELHGGGRSEVLCHKH